MFLALQEQRTLVPPNGPTWTPRETYKVSGLKFPEGLVSKLVQAHLTRKPCKTGTTRRTLPQISW